MSGIVDKVKNALHSDKHDSSTTHSHGTTSHGTTTGSSTNYENPQSSNSGPHASNIANKADPRIDSDNSKSGYGNQGTTSGYGNSHATSGVGSGTTSGYGNSGTHNNAYGSTNAGPHDSNLANKADPRVDSDRDGSHNAHNTHTSHNTGVSSGVGTSHAHGTAGTNHGSTFAGQTTSGSTTAGPHNSNIANKLDPRVDSDRDGSRNAGAATNSGYTGTSGTSGYSGTHAGNNVGGNTGYNGGVSRSTNAGPHDSNIANKADPRVDSDLDNRGNRHGASTGGVFGVSGSHATAGSGTAQNTAGPHNSDMLNKLDPRVDSDRDGSKTVGGNATHQ
jgi:hypothetical protein